MNIFSLFNRRTKLRAPAKIVRALTPFFSIYPSENNARFQCSFPLSLPLCFSLYLSFLFVKVCEGGSLTITALKIISSVQDKFLETHCFSTCFDVSKNKIKIQIVNLT